MSFLDDPRNTGVLYLLVLISAFLLSDRWDVLRQALAAGGQAGQAKVNAAAPVKNVTNNVTNNPNWVHTNAGVTS